MATITTDLSGLKKLGKEFLDGITSCKTPEELENGFKCFTLAYFGCVCNNEREQLQSEVLLKIIMKKYEAAVIENGWLISQ